MVPPHWTIIDKMARGTGDSVVIPAYGLAPEHNVDEAFDLLTDLVTQIRKEHPDGRIFLAGDSAGGGMSLAFAQEHREDNLRPDGLLLLSPWIDGAMENPEARKLEKVDGMLGVDGLRYWAEQWAGKRDVTDPRVSPALGDLSNLPPTWASVGGREILLPDVQKFADSARAAGTPVDLYVAPDGFHVFVALPFTKEGRTAYAQMHEMLKRK